MSYYCIDINRFLPARIQVFLDNFTSLSIYTASASQHLCLLLKCLCQPLKLYSLSSSTSQSAAQEPLPASQFI